MTTNYESLEKGCWHIGSTTMEDIENLKPLSAFGYKEVYSSEVADELIKSLMDGERYYARDNDIHPFHRVVYSFYAQGSPITPDN